jgi:uncharacterized protein (DUF3084 family)
LKANRRGIWYIPAMLDTTDLPDDIAALKAMLMAAKAREAGKDAQIARQNAQIASKDEHIARKDERIERLESTHTSKGAELALGRDTLQRHCGSVLS